MKSLTQFIEESLIKENFGEFKNAQEVVTKIIDVIKGNENKNKLEIDVSEFDLPFKTIILLLDKTSSNTLNAEYNRLESNFNEHFISIKIKYNEKDIKVNGLKKIIIHELTHAICDFNLNKIGKTLYDLLSSKHFKDLESNIKAYNSSSNLVVNNVSNNINEILYFLNNAERNAYLSRLKSDIFDILDEYKIDVRSSNGYESLIKEIKNIPAINKIFKIGEFIENIKNLSDSDKHSITLKYNNLHRYSKNWNTYKRIDTINTINDIESMWAKFIKKFNEYVPKICAEYYEKHIL